jgi:hypothetical protein
VIAAWEVSVTCLGSAWLLQHMFSVDLLQDRHWDSEPRYCLGLSSPSPHVRTDAEKARDEVIKCLGVSPRRGWLQGG